MSVAARLYAFDDEERRDASRLSSQLDSTMRDPDAKPIDIVINDISPTGFRASSPARLEEGSSVRVGLPGVGMVEARVVRHAAGEYGCMFLTPISPEQIRTALSADPVVWGAFPLMSPPSETAAPAGDKYPALVSFSLIAGAATACWAAIIGLTMAFLR